MIKRQGSNKCFNCRNILKWIIIKRDNINSSYYSVNSEADGIQADEIAIGIGEYEILVTCPKCGTKNKFIEKNS